MHAWQQKWCCRQCPGPDPVQRSQSQLMFCISLFKQLKRHFWRDDRVDVSHVHVVPGCSWCICTGSRSCTCRASSKASSRSTLSWAPKNLSNTCSCSGKRREVLASGLVTVDVVAVAAAAAVAARAFSAPGMKILIVYLLQMVRSQHVLLKTCSRAVLLQPACLAQWC